MQHPGAAIAFTVAGGKVDLVLGYACGGSADLGLLVNGDRQSQLQLPKTGGWADYKAVKLTASLKPGQNRLEIRNEGRGGGNLDYIDLKVE